MTITKDDSLMAQDFDAAVRSGYFKRSIGRAAICTWITKWCYDHMEDGEYSSQSIEDDISDMQSMILDEDGKLEDEYAEFIYDEETKNQYNAIVETFKVTANQFSEVENLHLCENQGLFFATFDVMSSDKKVAKGILNFYSEYFNKYFDNCSLGDLEIEENDCDGETFYIIEVYV